MPMKYRRLTAIEEALLRARTASRDQHSSSRQSYQDSTYSSLRKPPDLLWKPIVASGDEKSATRLLDFSPETLTVAKDVHVDLDIIALHELGGDPVNTWLDPQTITVWLHDYLQSDFPQSRVLSFGYSTQSLLENNKPSISHLARLFIQDVLNARTGIANPQRPLVLLGYSFGGVLVKEVLNQLRFEKLGLAHPTLLDAVVHVIFMGVPNKSDDPDFMTVWREVITYTLGAQKIKKADMAVAVQLIHGTTVAFDSWSLDRQNQIELSNIIESMPVANKDGKKVVLVPVQSVRSGHQSPGSMFLAKGKNHAQLCAFSTLDDPIYEYVRETVRRVFNGLSSSSELYASSMKLTAIWDDHNAIHELVCAASPGTCEWIFSDTTYQAWTLNPGGVLVVEGAPFCGKTVLARHLTRGLMKESSSLVLSYACSSMGHATNKEALMKSLLHQLFRQEPSLAISAISRNPVLREGAYVPFEVLDDIFRNSLETLALRDRRVFCIVDGLDNCGLGDSFEILSALHCIDTFPKHGLIVTRRSLLLPSIETQFENRVILEMTPTLVNSEISVFVDHTIESHQLSQSDLDRVREFVVRQSEGSFLHAKLACDDLLRSLDSGYLMLEIERQISSSVWGNIRRLYERDLSLVMKDPLGEIILSILLVAFERLETRMMAKFCSASKLVTHSEYPVTVLQVENSLRSMRSLISFENGLVKLTQDSQRYLESEFETRNTTMGNRNLAAACMAEIHEGSSGSPTELGYQNGSFMDYSVKYWMIHLQKCEEIADKDLIDSAYGLFAIDPRVGCWVYGYEHLTLDTIPQVGCWVYGYELLMLDTIPQTGELGPLFGGSCFGLSTVVERALKSGLSPSTQDESGRIALHWASERGHLNVVSLLLQSGSNPNSQTKAGWTCVHLAARRGHIGVVKVLLAHGAIVDLPAFDGRTALHFAVEAENWDTVRELTACGADPALTTLTGASILELAKGYSPAALIARLGLEPHDVDRLIGSLISEKASEILTSLLSSDADIVGRSYPWALDLINDGVTAAEVSDILLKSEHLVWLDLGEVASDVNEGADLMGQIGHLQGCAHEAYSSAVLNRPDIRASKTLNSHEPQSDPRTEALEYGQESPESATNTSSLDYDLEIENAFSKMDIHEQQMLRICGVAGVFHPSTGGEHNPGHATFLGDLAQIIYEDPSEAPSYLPLASTHWPLAIEDTPEVQEVDDVTMHDSSPSPYDDEMPDTVSVWTYNSVESESNFEIWDQSKTKRILLALRNVLRAIARLNQMGGCCDRIPILVRPMDGGEYLHTVAIGVEQLQIVLRQLQVYSDGSDKKERGWTDQLMETCLNLFRRFSWARKFEEYMEGSLGNTASPIRCMNLCALLTQILSIGVVTYTRGHSREFTHNNLSRSIEVFKLLGCDGAGPAVYARRVDLKCLGDMLGRQVWAFSLDLDARHLTKYSVSIRIEDLLDIWGGEISFDNEDGVSCVQIHVGDGVLKSPDDQPKGVLQDGVGLVKCHWDADRNSKGLPAFVLESFYRLLIGATVVNDRCGLERDACHECVSDKLFLLGTEKSRWKTTGRTFGVSGGARGGAFTASVAQTREDGKSWKARVMDSWEKDRKLIVLNSPWGLELSLCTGIARRVPLRKFFYGEVLEYMALAVDKWAHIETIVQQVAEAKTNAEFGALIKGWTSEQREVLREATGLLLLALERTGVERNGQNLVLWWPERHEQPRGLRISKAQCSGENPWLSMIKDSETCAVFGLVTSRCLQHEGVKICQNTRPLAWESIQNIVLETSLTILRGNPAISTPPFVLGQHLMLWKRPDYLRVVRTVSTPEDVARLEYRGQMPRSVARLLMKFEDVREQQALSDSGYNVLVSKQVV